MNWVGGVRSRLKVKNERKRQQDFFEKKKFSSKVKKLETAGSPSERKQAISLDLVSLQAANFSAAHFKKNGSGIRSSGRIKRVDLDKTRGLFRQKFVNLPDASPETKPSALSLSKPSPQKSVSCPKLHPTSRTHTLTTITEDNAPTVADISNQDLFQTLTNQKEQSHFWTSTPANFWHKKKRLDRHKSVSTAQVNDHYTVKKEPAFHSPSTSEKILLDCSREQMELLDEGECWAGKTPKTPGSTTSAWSDLSTIMEDTDEATVPSIDDDNDWEHHVRNNKVSSQSYSESVQSLDVPTSQWTLEMGGEEPLSNDPDSTLSSFKDCHKMEYPVRDSYSRDSTKPIQHSTAKEEYSSSTKMNMECQIKNQACFEHASTTSQPSNTIQASSEVPLRAFNIDAAVPRDQHIVPKVRKEVQAVDEQQTVYQRRNTDHQPEGQAQHDSVLHRYADMKEQRDLACHESSSFTSPEDSGTYLMTERAKLDKYRQNPSQHDSEPSQRHHMHNETSWQCPTPEKGKNANSVLGHTSSQEFISAMYCSNYDDQVKNMHQSAAVVNKIIKRQMSGDQGTNVDIMNLYSSQTKQTASTDGERSKVTLPIHLSCKPQSVLTQIQDSNEASLVNKQDDDKSSCGAPDDESVISDKDDAESSASSDRGSTDSSSDMDLVTETDASSINNWLGFVHNAQGMNRAENERKPTDIRCEGSLIKDVPATAQQMLEEVLALDRELQKETLTEDKDEVRERTSILVSGRDRSVEKLCDSSQSQAKDILQEVHDITSPRKELKTLLRSIPRNAKPEDAVKEQEHKVQGIDMEGKYGLNVKVTVGSKVNSTRTEETAATLPPEKSKDKTTKAISEETTSPACETSSFQTAITSQMDVISTTVAITDDDPGKMPSVVSTSSGTGTDADSMTVGEKVLCDQSVQCTLIGDPLPMPQGRGGLKDGESQDINMSSHDIVMIESSTCDSIANTQSSRENDFESCVSTP